MLRLHQSDGQHEARNDEYVGVNVVQAEALHVRAQQVEPREQHAAQAAIEPFATDEVTTERARSHEHRLHPNHRARFWIQREEGREQVVDERNVVDEVRSGKGLPVVEERCNRQRGDAVTNDASHCVHLVRGVADRGVEREVPPEGDEADDAHERHEASAD